MIDLSLDVDTRAYVVVTRFRDARSVAAGATECAAIREWNMMHAMLRHRPSGPLSRYVDQFWYRRGRFPERRRERALPTGSMDLTFNLHDDALRVFADADDTVGPSARHALVHGAQSKYFVLDARVDVHVLGVHFRPGGGAVLLGIPADALTDQHVALEDLWGERARVLRERLLDAVEPDRMFAVLEEELMRVLTRAPLVNPAISFALRGIQSSPQVRIAEIQEATGYGARRFTTLFESTVGLTPKLYSRIQRMRRLVERVAQLDDRDWADLAGEFGYYDQPHLTREFRELTGVTPSEYRQARRGSPLHTEIDR
jgi:AraC-like DNA-binding protein